MVVGLRGVEGGWVGLSSLGAPSLKTDNYTYLAELIHSLMHNLQHRWSEELEMKNAMVLSRIRQGCTVHASYNYN